MNTKIYILFLFVFTLLQSCKEENKTTIIASDTYLTATINGEAFSSSVQIISFRANKQTYLITADNPDASEYAFKLIIKNDKDNDPNKIRYGFVEAKDASGNNTTWKLPDNFDFTSKAKDSGGYIEGGFSFVAYKFTKGIEDKKKPLKVTNGKFRAKIPSR